MSVNLFSAAGRFFVRRYREAATFGPRLISKFAHSVLRRDMITLQYFTAWLFVHSNLTRSLHELRKKCHRYQRNRQNHRALATPSYFLAGLT
jgi:hypothetical protein